jgi:bacterioferritin (cytochrome b1)
MVSSARVVPLSQVHAWTERIHEEYVEGESLVKMVIEDLMAGRISVAVCRDIIKYLRDQDATTRDGLKGILEVNGQRAGDAANRAARIAANFERKAVRTRWS